MPAVTELRTVFAVVRPEDLVVLTFGFRNLGRDPANPLRLIRVNVDEPALIWVTLPPQHVAEQAFFEVAPSFPVNPTDPDYQTGTNPPEPPPVKTRLAGRSTLTFQIPKGTPVPEIELTLEGLLKACTGLPLLLAPAAMRSMLAVDGSQIARPSIETALEVPYRLFLSPDENARWIHAHALDKDRPNGRIDLWHTRLGVHDGKVPAGVDETDASAPSRLVRAIWSPDFRRMPQPAPPHSNLPFRMPLDAYDRYNIVHQSVKPIEGAAIPQPFRAGAIAVRQLMLSSLGAWIDVRGEWKKSSGLTVQEWSQRGTMGRDHYVRVVYAGYLFPFGHAASLVKVTERKLRQTPDQGIVAYLFQRMYVVVREPEKSYADSGAPSYGRKMPFKKLRITTLVTPDLSPPGQTSIRDKGQSAFWPQVAGRDFLFHMIGEDGDQQKAELSAPLIFIGDDLANNLDFLDAVRNDYDVAAEQRRQRPLRGQQVAFAPSKVRGDTTLETHALTFSARSSAGQPAFSPIVAEALVGLPALRHLLRIEEKVKIGYLDGYAEAGFDAANKGEVFCKVKLEPLDPQLSLSFSKQGDRAGGIAQPNMTITGLSRRLGPVAAVDEIAKGSVDPARYFDSEAKLFGGVALKDILPLFVGDLDKLPKIVATQTGVSFTWKPDLRSNPIFKAEVATIDLPEALKQALNNQPAPAKMDLSVELKNEPASATIHGKLENFTLDLLPGAPLISVAFKVFEFVSENGRKPYVNVDLYGIRFQGVLSFVEILKTYIPANGFSDPPFINWLENGIQAGYSLPIPSIELGVFSLQNLSLGSALTVPFDGDPLSLAFNFCARQSPFLLSVGGIGGGGFFGLTLTAKGVQLLEASLEFGACLAGEVHVMGGIYFKMVIGAAKIEGYVRIGGSMDVLGLISASIELNLSLTYDTATKKVWGRAAMTIDIDVLFFSKSVEITVERRFAGSGADPPFRVMMGRYDAPGGEVNPWSDYCAAFA